MTEHGSLTYVTSGVDIRLGDLCSRIAYEAAKRTFESRRGRVGHPRALDGGFSSLLDLGEFYLCVNSDGIGSKVQVAQAMNQHHTLGYDLVAMVADDAVCVGAEPVAMVNTLDMERVDEQVVRKLMGGLEQAATEALVAVVGGEIAEMRDNVRGYVWSASLIGMVRKDRVIDGSAIMEGETVVALLTDNFRSNGFTLVRRILEGAFGPWWHRVKYDEHATWGEKILAPSQIYAPFLVETLGGFKGKPSVEIHGIAHITGGGLKHNVRRILPRGLDIKVSHLPPPPPVIARVKDLGKIPNQEAYRVWNMGIGMVLITPEPERLAELAAVRHIGTRVIGEVVKKGDGDLPHDGEGGGT